MSDYQWALVAIVPIAHRAAANQLAAAIDPDTGGIYSFDDGHGIKCYPPGTTFGPAPMFTTSAQHTHMAAGALLKADGYGDTVEFLGGAPFPRLNARGFADAQVLGLKSVMVVDAGPRAQYENYVREFIALNGLVTP